MTFIERMKKDKNYRFKIVLIGVIIMLIIGNSGENKKEAPVLQSICNQANRLPGALFSGADCSGFPSNIMSITNNGCLRYDPIHLPGNDGINIEDKNLCFGNLCKIGTYQRSGILVPDIFGCFSCVPDGLRAKAGECCNDEVIIDNKDDYLVLCKALAPGVDPSTRECNSAMEGVGSIVQQIVPDLNLGCRSAFYITVFSGAMIIMFIFAAI